MFEDREMTSYNKETDASNDESNNVITYDDGRDRSLTSRKTERERLEEDMERFLSGGGQIEQVERDVRMDPPRKPESNYGSRPI
jgi:hypothetical protein